MTVKTPHVADDAVTRLQHLIQDIRIAMLITHDSGSELHGRPMVTQRMPFNGHLWFLTSASSPKAFELVDDASVALVYADPATQRYVHVSGKARLRSNPEMAERLWSDEHQPWLPLGRDDPDLRLLEVTVTRALYWMPPRSPSSRNRDRGAPLSGTIEFEHSASTTAGEHALTQTIVRGVDLDAHNTGRVGRRHGSARR